MKKMEGVIPALLTPLDIDGGLKENVLKQALDYYLDKGALGFYLGGSTGEGPILTLETRKAMMKVVKEHVGDKSVIIAHVGSADTKTAVELAAYAREVCLDAIAAVPPYYYKIDIQGLIQYYTQISEAAELPLILYNFPMGTGVTINSDMMNEFVNIKNVIGIKYTDFNLIEMEKIKLLKEGSLKVFYGVDQMNLCGLMMGADGIIGSFHNILPKPYVEMYRAYRDDDIKTARRLQHEINKYINICKKYTGLITLDGLKQVMKMLGFDFGTVTPPLIPMKEQDARLLKEKLDNEGFFEFIK